MLGSVGVYVLCDDLGDGTVSDQLLQSLVDVVGYLAVLCECDRIVLAYVLAVKYHKTVVSLDECFCRLVVDYDAVDLIGEQSCNCVGACGECLNVIFAEATVFNGIGGVGVAGGADLAADLDVLARFDLCKDVVGRGNVAVFG